MRIFQKLLIKLYIHQGCLQPLRGAGESQDRYLKEVKRSQSKILTISIASTFTLLECLGQEAWCKPKHGHFTYITSNAKGNQQKVNYMEKISLIVLN